MSRNLTTSSCPTCDYTVRMSDLRGKSIEFRRYGSYAPQIGCRFDCPCGVVYFAMWRHRDAFWSEEHLKEGSWKEPMIRGTEWPNTEAGRFAVERTSWSGKTETHQTGCFTIDLSFWASYNDEQEDDDLVRLSIEAGDNPPAHLCTDDALDVQWVW